MVLTRNEFAAVTCSCVASSRDCTRFTVGGNSLATRFCRNGQVVPELLERPACQVSGIISMTDLRAVLDA
jgi:hypothetical protein